ncbi:hypothetical protein MCUN1_002178 [Malassezia cuniculi]|uniref:Uncharacterized protein n=1 Tax=Malassezia cuniculi TaxID=948313 RepID=A0AAF0EVB3_9BASI|nr:hypothetical protein MCUN1_002178 [Malassezia cuniculi]
MPSSKAADYAARASAAQWADDLQKLVFERDADPLADVTWPGTEEKAHFVALVYAGSFDPAVQLSSDEALQVAQLAAEHGVRGAVLGVFAAAAPSAYGEDLLLLLDAVRQTSASEGRRIADALVGNADWGDIAGFVSGDALVRRAQHSVPGPECVEHFAQLIKSRAWKRLLAQAGATGATGDLSTLDRICAAVVRHVQPQNAADIYCRLLGDVMLPDDGSLPQGAAYAELETCRRGLLAYISRNWPQMRAEQGFDRLPTWCLKELSQELSVEPAALLKEPRVATAPAKGDAGSMLAVTSAGFVPLAPSTCAPLC